MLALPLLWLKLLRITQRAFLPQPSTLITLPQMTATEAARYRSTLLAIAQAGMALRVVKHGHHPMTRRASLACRRTADNAACEHITTARGTMLHEQDGSLLHERLSHRNHPHMLAPSADTSMQTPRS